MRPSLVTDMQLDEAWNVSLACQAHQAACGYRLCDACRQGDCLRYLRQYAGAWPGNCCVSQIGPGIPLDDALPRAAQICRCCGDAPDSLPWLAEGACCRNCKRVAINASFISSPVDLLHLSSLRAAGLTHPAARHLERRPMTTTPFYDDLIASIPPGLERLIFMILKDHVGEANKIRLDDLCLEALGSFNTSTERQVREVIEILRRDFHVPVISESGKAGRWLAANTRELQVCIAEMQNRHDHLGDVIRSLRQAQVPAATPQFERVRSVPYTLWS